MRREPALAGLSADDIAGLLRVSKGSVYRYAHLYRWRRYTQAGRVYYHPGDVAAVLDRLNQDEDCSAPR
ncbi:hypothetical protein RND61_25725 [Streptomyces sp. TRM76323]|uniref:Helix-turn-helix domain-containing protein n=1 Tax=Streptomyces tamarix TaxID=3078565 RepID=A0ABU3QSE6_9ACTN|nr:hypothetical protein [Streptomyces tamarix]MDT9685438.1 hypothetical protein [Streptomyces tamarix]